jgi:hypothetical protein
MVCPAGVRHFWSIIGDWIDQNPNEAHRAPPAAPFGPFTLTRSSVPRIEKNAKTALRIAS